MAKKEKIVYQGTPAGSWMVTFSDMNTLLLTFFVLLFSMSTIATEQFDEMFNQRNGDGLGLLSDETRSYSGSLLFDPTPLLPKNSVTSALNVFRANDERTGKGQINLPDGVEIRMNDGFGGEISILLADKLLFQPGQTELTEQSRKFLAQMRDFLLKIISTVPRRVVVEGHTDNSTPTEEGYIMSARRAINVLEFLLEDGTLPPELFTVVGYGSAKPLVPNTSDQNRARNRRVRILLEPLEQAAEANQR